MWDGLERVILAHSSEKNNRPELAEVEARKVTGGQVDIVVAGQHTVSGPYAPGAMPTSRQEGQPTNAGTEGEIPNPTLQHEETTVEVETIHAANLPRHIQVEKLMEQIDKAERLPELMPVIEAMRHKPDPHVERALRLKRRELGTMKVPKSPWF
jgi:hypothetical protein